jgi:hypothetical protein
MPWFWPGELGNKSTKKPGTFCVEGARANCGLYQDRSVIVETSRLSPSC